MKYPMITAAVVAALAGTNAAHALNVNDTVNAPAQLVAAGASAARDSFLAELNASVCQAGTLTAYRASPTALQDFRAYSCTIVAGGTVGPLFGAAAGQNATIYYRSEGGSGWGPGSIATNVTIQSLLVDNRCVAGAAISTPSGAVPAFDCSVSGYALATDNVTSGLTRRATQLGVSDEEPNMYTESNYPGVASNRFPPFSATVKGQLNGLSRTVGFAQVFGVLLSNNGATSGITSLTPAEVSAIYSGAITDWNDTINPATGQKNPDGAITVVRRENGSGTQVAAAQQFLGTLACQPSALTFVTDGSDADSAACTAGNPSGGTNTDGVLERGTTSDLEACIGFNPGAIGPNVFKGSAPANTHYAQINQVTPSKYNAAKGVYNYWYEMTLQKQPGLTGLPNAVASGLISISQRLANTPATDSVMALPNLSNTPVIPVVNTGVPISLASRNGNSCSAPTQVALP
jgi:PBP superfamily domain